MKYFYAFVVPFIPFLFILAILAPAFIAGNYFGLPGGILGLLFGLGLGNLFIEAIDG